jgi:DNA-binding NarL/FixJ family response regulator
MSVKILLADDHKIMREGLRSLIEKKPDMEVVAEAENGRMTVQLARRLRPDVVIMDVAMPDMNGMEATHRIIDGSSGVKVIALSVHSDRRFVAGMLSAGASGYLLKDCAFEELEHAIQAVILNRIYLGNGIANIVVGDYVTHLRKSDSPAFSVLTAREREVLQLLAEGKTTKQIASCLSVSIKTVETHRRQIMDKLNLDSIAELTKYAIREGLTHI